MKRASKLLTITIAAVLVTAVFVSAYAKDGVEMTGSGEDVSASEMISLMIPQEDEESKPVTADGELSDFLVPGNNNEDNNAQNSGTSSYQVSGSPNILIYHTHNTEAYRQVDGARYEESGSWRTYDEKNNVIAVGEVMKQKLEEYGFEVIHDKTDHEPPKLTTAYDRSEVTMKKYLEQYPDIDIFIDLHRDAMAKDVTDDYVMIDGKKCAKMMFVVGKGEKFDDKPDFKTNYSFANSINQQLSAMDDGLVRNICIKTGRYNQHIGELSCLIEIGHNRNTLEEAKNSAELFAKALSKVVSVDNG